jgi:hypothetical protein
MMLLYGLDLWAMMSPLLTPRWQQWMAGAHFPKGTSKLMNIGPLFYLKFLNWIRRLRCRNFN